MTSGSAVKTTKQRVRRHWLVLIVALAAFVCSLVVRDTVFPLYSGNKDEAVYVMQAKTLADGHVTLPTEGRETKFTRPFLTGIRDGRIFFAFPAGWPAFLAVSQLLFGTMRIGLALLCAATVIALYLFALEITRERRMALIASTMLALSPIFIIQSGLFLSYLYTLFLGFLFGFAVLRGARVGSKGLLALAGALLGVIFLTRPFDAGLWAAPFGVYFIAIHRRRWHELLPIIGWTAVGFAPLFAITVGYNIAVTGKPLLFPITAAESLNKFGFGLRRLAPTAKAINYQPSKAFDAALHNFDALPAWVLGSWAGIALALGGLVLRRRAATTWLLLGIAIVFPLGYLYYWGLVLMADGAQGIGPQYYIPMLAPLTILGATALVWIWDQGKLVAAGVGVVALVISVPILTHKIDDQQLVADNYQQSKDALDAAHFEHALVFVPYFRDPFLLTELSFAMNRPDLGGPALYAVDLETPNLTMAAKHPDRTPYLLERELQPGRDVFRSRVKLQQLSLEHGRAFSAHERITNPGNDKVVVAYVDAGRGIEQRVLDTASSKGKTYTFDWVVDAGGSVPNSSTVTPPNGLSTIAVGVAFGTTDRIDGLADRWERRFPTRADAKGLEVLTPGVPYHRYIFPKVTAWERANVDAVLRVKTTVHR
jgi:Dolichyl-phosphate-mannose-protein mannosyltransferase